MATIKKEMKYYPESQFMSDEKLTASLTYQSTACRFSFDDGNGNETGFCPETIETIIKLYDQLTYRCDVTDIKDLIR